MFTIASLQAEEMLLFSADVSGSAAEVADGADHHLRIVGNRDKEFSGYNWLNHLSTR